MSGVYIERLCTGQIHLPSTLEDSLARVDSKRQDTPALRGWKRVNLQS